MRWLVFAVGVLFITACAELRWRLPGVPAVMTWADVAALPLPPSGIRAAYGEDPLQFGELRMPEGTGPHPVVAIVHGGCWLSAFDYRHATHAAAALTKRGYATWTIEYRRIGDVGGGWPNTFTDVLHGVNHLRTLSKNHALDLSRVLLMGHSAGGQMVLWLAGHATSRADDRPNEAGLDVPAPLAVAGVVALAPITDLAAYRHGEPGSCNAAVEPLMGGTELDHPARYQLVSPIAHLPVDTPLRIIQGEQDVVVPPGMVRAYAAAAREAGAQSQLRLLENAGHFEMVVPGSIAWPAITRAIADVLGD